MIHALLGDTLKNYAIAATSNQDAVEDASTIHIIDNTTGNILGYANATSATFKILNPEERKIHVESSQSTYKTCSILQKKIISSSCIFFF